RRLVNRRFTSPDAYDGDARGHKKGPARAGPLFSLPQPSAAGDASAAVLQHLLDRLVGLLGHRSVHATDLRHLLHVVVVGALACTRSEEHTSELQSRSDLV